MSCVWPRKRELHFDAPEPMKQVIVCTNHRSNPGQPSCSARGSESLADRLQQEISARGLNIKLERFPCLGRCVEGPNLKLSPGGHFISEITPDTLESVLHEIEAFSLQSD